MGTRFDSTTNINVPVPKGEFVDHPADLERKPERTENQIGSWSLAILQTLSVLDRLEVTLTPLVPFQRGLYQGPAT